MGFCRQRVPERLNCASFQRASLRHAWGGEGFLSGGNCLGEDLDLQEMGRRGCDPGEMLAWCGSKD